jgi:hypothetical protein
MIAAIVIPILFLYFLYITLKERKRKYEEYLKLDDIKEEALISGQIIQINTKSKTFVGEHDVTITSILLIGENSTQYKAVKTSPSTTTTPTLKEGFQVVCYGYWKKDLFIFYRFKTIDPK